MKKLLDWLKSLFVKKKYIYEVREETRKLNLGISQIQIYTKDKGVHTLEFRGYTKAKVVDNKLEVKIKTSKELALECVTMRFNDLAHGGRMQEAFIPVTDEAQPNVTYRRRSDIANFILMHKDLEEEKTFRYEIKKEVTNV